MEKLGKKIRTELFRDFSHALDHVNTEIGSIKQFLPKLMEAMTNKKSVEVVDPESADKIPKDSSNSDELGNTSQTQGSLLTDSSSFASLFDPSKCNPRRGKLE